MNIRPETPNDIPAIHTVQCAAFDKPLEADLIDTIRQANGITLSLVAELDGKVVGHVLFSPGTLVSPAGTHPITTLGPVGVLPSQQNKGIGSTLIRAGLAQLDANSHDLIAVLGHPTYYPRFGFVPSIRYGIRCEFDVPDDVFMVRVSRPGTIPIPSGKILYHPAFHNL